MFDPSGRFELTIHPNGRRPADEYYQNGTTFIEGRDGSSYTIRFTNRTSTRVQVILAVDGLDVLRGQPAGPNSEGYVVNANSTIEVPGWKVNGSTAAEFEFAGVGKSYTSKIGQGTANAGVIGAMVFGEKVWTQAINTPWVQQYHNAGQNQWSAPANAGSPTPPWYSTNMGSVPLAGSVTATTTNGTPTAAINTVSIARGASGTTVSNEVGTGFGQGVDFNTTQVSFVREDPTNPDAIMAIYYDSARGLERRGIVLRRKGVSAYGNNPFPAYSPGVKPPPGWQG